MEGRTGALEEEVGEIAELGARFHAWRAQMDTASEQVASILGMVDTDSSSVRCLCPIASDTLTTYQRAACLPL